MTIQTAPIKVLSIVEATTINAVAKNLLEFHRVAREMTPKSSSFPDVHRRVVTFERKRDTNQPPNEFISALRNLNLEVEVINERRRFDLSAISSLRKVVADFNPDLVVTHSVKSHFLIWRSGVWREFPWLAFHHGYTTTDLKMRAYNRLDRWSLPHASRLATVCGPFARELAVNTRVPVEQIVVQHNSVRPPVQPGIDEVEALRQRLGIGDSDFVVLTVGRLSREKAQSDLLVAFKHLLDQYPDIPARLVVVGDGPERAKLETTVDEFGLKERVSFIGQVSDVLPYYALAGVFALPSHSEGSPNVVLEAMAANVPIVATAVGGVPEILVNNESALLVPTAKPTAMAEAITLIWKDKELAERLTRNSAELVASRFTPESYMESLTEIYREVISGEFSRPG